jgi:hypothetical protein
MKQKRGANGNGLPAVRGLTRGATYRLEPHIAAELAVYQAVRALGGISPFTQVGMVEEALREWFKRIRPTRCALSRS